MAAGHDFSFDAEAFECDLSLEITGSVLLVEQAGQAVCVVESAPTSWIAAGASSSFTPMPAQPNQPGSHLRQRLWH